MATIVGDISATQHNIVVSGAVTAVPGDIFVIASEKMQFTGYTTPKDPHTPNHAKISVRRGVAGTTAATHSSGATITGPFNTNALDVLSLKIAGVSATTSVATQTVQVEERTFVESKNSGTYTATVVVPIGATVLDVIWRNTALWTASVSASLVVGDNDDANGYIEATNLKSAPTADTNGAG
ncbi:MAG: hypothetical protein ABSB75_04765, partial [Candidatus Limnocylindrales bacterium]